MLYVYAFICGLGQHYSCQSFVFPETFSTRVECKAYVNYLKYNLKEGVLIRASCLRR